MPIHMSYFEKFMKGMSMTLILSLVVFIFSNLTYANKSIPDRLVNRNSGTIFISGRRVMRIRHSGDYSSIDERTEKIYKRLSDLFTHPPSGAINFYVAPESKQVIAYCNQKLLFSVYPSDASLNNSEMLDLALLWLNQIQMEFYRLYDGYEGRVVNKIIGLASWYGPRFSGRTTACEEVFNPYAFTAAHRTLPIGSILLVSNPDNGKKVVVRVNDRGPRSKNREIDLSLAAAKAIGIHQSGVDDVTIEVIE